MNLSPKKMTGACAAILILLLPHISFAKYHFDVTPTISMSEVYEDNIYLSSTNEKSDYMTMVSPGVNLNMTSNKNNLMLQYIPTFVWYAQEENNNNVRHSGNMSFRQDLTRHLSFLMTDIYLKSEDPLEDTEDVEGVRDTRNTYQRNRANASLRYVFGPENELNIGCGHSFLENDDPAEDDSTTWNPFANFTYWFDMKNGLELNYGFTRADFRGEKGYVPGDDYRGYTAGIRYTHRFSPHTLGSVGYKFTTRHFEGLEEDYKIHEGSAGFECIFSPDLSVSLGIGYHIQKNKISDNEKGYNYNALLNRKFRRVSLTFIGLGGWDEAYQEAERRGFSQYWSASTDISVQLFKTLAGYAMLSYRSDKDEIDRKWNTSRAGISIRWTFSRWYSLLLEYSFAKRDDDDPTEDYRSNELMLKLDASRLFRW